MPVYKYLDVAMRHITYEDGSLLATWVGDPHVVEHEYGFFVSVPEDPEAPLRLDAPAVNRLKEFGVSDAFIRILRRALKAECFWVNFDRDAVEDDDLPVFPW